jgi:predicted 2-oxoglutarate/Fe(II)-dependent dioxygenase YbiX
MVTLETAPPFALLIPISVAADGFSCQEAGIGNAPKIGMPQAVPREPEIMRANQIVLGDPVPWFTARGLAGERIDLHLSAGRWVLLAFLEPLATSRAQARLASLANLAASHFEDHLAIYAVLSSPPADIQPLISLTSPALKFITDYDRSIASPYGDAHVPRSVVLDPMLRAVANIPSDPPLDHDRTLNRFLLDLPSVDDSVGVPLTAPVLIVPRVFDFLLCEHLIAIFEKIGGNDSGFLVAQAGKPATVIDHSRKRRQDLLIVSPELRQIIRDRIVKRLLPAIELYFQFKATHMDRYIVACYDSAIGGHFFRHRDNMNPGVEHRRFAVSLNLNSNYEGCDLMLPEFGRRAYRAPAGGAIVFSCGALHEVTAISKGRRYAFLPFLYGESDLKKSMENDALLQQIGVDYQADQHALNDANANDMEKPRNAV